MRIAGILLVGCCLLSACVGVQAQGPLLTGPGGAPGLPSQVLEEPSAKRLPPIANQAPMGEPSAARGFGPSLAPGSVPVASLSPGQPSYQQALESSGWCDEAIDAPHCCSWFGSAAALIMTRSTKGDRVWTSSDSLNGALIQNTDQAEAGWTGGF